jgi:hypothetical protein
MLMRCRAADQWGHRRETHAMAQGARERVSRDVVQAVWEAEDGRCEGCTRPMDKRCARVTRVDDTRPERTADNLHLVCVDCKARRPDLLMHMVLAEEVTQRVVGELGPEQAAQASRWLLATLRKYGVILTLGPQWRSYWLPGIGRFRVTPGAAGAPAVVTVETLAPAPQLRIKPQARTRGLPRPTRQPHAAAMTAERSASPRQGAGALMPTRRAAAPTA